MNLIDKLSKLDKKKRFSYMYKIAGKYIEDSSKKYIKQARYHSLELEDIINIRLFSMEDVFQTIVKRKISIEDHRKLSSFLKTGTYFAIMNHFKKSKEAPNLIQYLDSKEVSHNDNPSKVLIKNENSKIAKKFISGLNKLEIKILTDIVDSKNIKQTCEMTGISRYEFSNIRKELKINFKKYEKNRLI